MISSEEIISFPLFHKIPLQLPETVILVTFTFPQMCNLSINTTNNVNSICSDKYRTVVVAAKSNGPWGILRSYVI